MRLDVFLVEKGHFETRSKAQLAIREGRIRVNGRQAVKSGLEVGENDSVEYDCPELTFVSRGGYKLQEALIRNGIVLKNKTVLDIGASTGGFTDCALQNGARHVYAYDVGHDQLDKRIRNDKRVTVGEHINCRDLEADDFSEPIDFICMDVSFISCTKMLKAISSVLRRSGECVVLFKPQFEVGSQHLNRQGIVTDDRITEEKLAETLNSLKDYDLEAISVIPSPIKGGDGNKEYLIYMKKN